MTSDAVLQMVAVSNDITFNSGAFGTREDAVFRAATEYALEEKLPLVYLAANAGARVGLANEVKQCLQVGFWAQPLYHEHAVMCICCCLRSHRCRCYCTSLRHHYHSCY